MGAFLIGAIDPLIPGIDAILKHQLLGQSRVEFFLGDPVLVAHLLQAVFLADTVFFRTGLVIGSCFAAIRIVTEGVIGNGDQAGILRHSQILQFLAEIGGSGTFHAVATTAKIDDIQIILQNDILIIALFKFQRAENFQQLTLNGNIVRLLIFRQEQVLDQLLGNGGTAELPAAAHKQVQACLDGGDPVNTLVLVKALVLQRDRGTDQLFRQVCISHPLAVRCGEDLLDHFRLAIGIDGINIGSFIQLVIIQIHFRQRNDLILQIVAQNADKHKATDAHDQHNRQHRSSGYLNAGIQHSPRDIQKTHKPGGLPVLALHPALAVFFFSHKSYLHKRLANKPKGLVANAELCLQHWLSHYSTSFPKTKDLICEHSLKDSFPKLSQKPPFSSCFLPWGMVQLSQQMCRRILACCFSPLPTSAIMVTITFLRKK